MPIVVRWKKGRRARNRSPYLSNGWRLADVVAAIQVMGAYPSASRKVGDWTSKLGNPLSADSWADVFRQHPEFFRLNGKWASLRWRHAYDRTYDAVEGRELTPGEVSSLPEAERKHITRRPLASDQIEALLKTAVELHARSVAHRAETRWLSPLLFALLGGILAALLKP